MASILLVESTRGDRSRIVNALRAEGHALQVVGDGLTALAWIEHAAPDLVLCEIAAPRLNALHLIPRVRAKPQGTLLPIIVLTRIDDRRAVRAALRAGADDCIMRDESLSELLAAVKAQLERSFARKEAVGQAVEISLETQRQQLGAAYERRLMDELNTRWDRSAPPSGHFQASASALYVDAPAELPQGRDHLKDHSLALTRFFQVVNDAAYLFNASETTHTSNGVLALFRAGQDEDDTTHVRRAMRAAQALTHSLRLIIERADAMGYRPAIAVHSGVAAVVPLLDPLHDINVRIPAGEVVLATRLLHSRAKLEGWPLVTSRATLAALRRDAPAVLASAALRPMYGIAEALEIDCADSEIQPVNS